MFTNMGLRETSDCLPRYLLFFGGGSLTGGSSVGGSSIGGLGSSSSGGGLGCSSSVMLTANTALLDLRGGVRSVNLFQQELLYGEQIPNRMHKLVSSLVV